MKKFFLIFSLCLLFAVAGCSKDKPTGEILPDSEASDDDIVDAEPETSDDETLDEEITDEESSDTETSDEEDSDIETSDGEISDEEDSDTGISDDEDPETDDSADDESDDGLNDGDEADDADPTGEDDEDQTGDEDQPEDEDQTGDEDQPDEDTELTEEEKCITASGIWNDVSKECLPPVLGRICTNQKKCYNNKAEIDCSGSDFPGQDPYFAALGKCIPQEFDVQSPAYDEPVVIDMATGLVWAQSYSPAPYSWGNAQDYCETLKTSNDSHGYAGITDWRVPTVQELFTIVDNGRHDPAFDGTVFPNMQGLYDNGLNLWTSQDMNDGAGYYFTPNDGGNWYAAKEDDDVNVVCVSGVKMLNASFDVKENVVVDETTGLVWQKEYESGKTWAEALSYCKSLNDENYAGFDDWRLPNKNELASLLDLDKNSAPYSAFPNMPDTPVIFFWSSSTWADSPNLAWFADFSRGLIGINPKDEGSYALCVR